MKYFIVYFLILFSVSISFANEGTKFCNSSNVTSEVSNKVSVLEGLLAKNNATEDASRRGCCSHHNGVCGCSNGRAVCCDNTLSPSCGCD
jgi:hypothetical protein